MLFAVLFAGCGGGSAAGTPIAAVANTVAAPSAPASTPVATAAATVTTRHSFVGAFYRPAGNPPYGVFAANSPQTEPSPYPTPGSVLFGAAGYCDAVQANGVSITSGFIVDPTKVADIVNLGVRWTRSMPSAFLDDLSHVFGPGTYAFGDFDAAQCALQRSGITPVISIEAGPVQYNATLGQFSPHSVPVYATPADFAGWCSAVAAHEHQVFPTATRFTIPGNEVNDNAALFPAGNAQIAAYTAACYAAVKAANPAAFVYGFELNMDGSLNVPAFLGAMTSLGCGPGTCYDGIAMHLSLRYPLRPAGTPCYPNAGGDYTLQCIADVRAAARIAHVLITETVYPQPAYVPDEATKALAVAASFAAFAADPNVDGVLYANVDECASYPTGFFAGGCLISTTTAVLPAYTVLAGLATTYFY